MFLIPSIKLTAWLKGFLLFDNPILLFDNDFSIPFQDPVLVFGVTLLVILIVPFIFSKLKIPGIIGLILAGIALGNSGFGILNREGSIEFIGQIGLLYLIFLTGLELDMHSFIQNKKRNIVFGILTFSIPFIMGLLVCRMLLHFDLLPSLLISSMFSSQTLIAYPIVSRLRLTKIEPVGIAIAGTIITDTIVLVLLILIIALHHGQNSISLWSTLFVSISIYLAFIFYIFPRIIRWFFKNTSTDLIAQYIFVLAMVFVAGILAKLIKLEPIIGAFLAGIVLNKQIPHSSTLMSRIEFIGNSIFIPIFILYLGMLLDLNIFVSSWKTVELAIFLILMAVGSKWIAAYVTQKIYLYKTSERQLLFGLSTARAAATIAIILIGFQMSIVDSSILNATIVVVFASCLISAFVTERSAKSIAQKETPNSSNTESTDRIIVPISNPENIEALIEFSNYIKLHNRKTPIYVLSVLKNEKDIADNKLATKIEEISRHTEIPIDFIARIDISIPSGIVRASKEIVASKIIMGWNGNYSAKQWIFGSILEAVLRDCRQSVYVVSIKQSLQSIENIEVIVPPLAEFEPHLKSWLIALNNIAKQTSAKITFTILSDNYENFANALAAIGVKLKYTITNSTDWDSAFDSISQKGDNSLIVVISARKGSISHTSRIELIPRIVSKKFKNKNFTIIYPAQPQSTLYDTRAFLSGTGQVSIEDQT
ncbi:MAG: cation:proton antiporter [Bacteroidales bacterium]